MDKKMQRKRIAEMVFKSNKLTTEQKIEAINYLREGVGKSVGAMLALSILLKPILGPALWAVYRGLRAAFSERSRRCGAFAIGSARDYCMVLVKIEHLAKTIKILQRGKEECKKRKNPQKCVQAIDKSILKTMNKLKKAQEKARLLKMKKHEDIIKKGEEKAASGKGKWI